MKFHHLRNATARLEYGGKLILIDPMLSPQGTLDPFPAASGSTERNPLTELPVSAEEAVAGIDLVLVTHSHIDHWDSVAAQLLNKDTPIIVQDEYDARVIAADGFSNITILESELEWEGITFHKTAGQHYADESLVPIIEANTGSAATMGVVLTHSGEKTVYLTGDTVWFPGVEEALGEHKPSVIVANAGGNALPVPNGLLVFDDRQLLKVAQAAGPGATIIAVHMEAVNHWGTSKAQLRETFASEGYDQMLMIPEDGQSTTV